MEEYSVILKVFALRQQDIVDEKISLFERKVESIFFAETVWFTFIKDETIELENIPILIEVKFKKRGKKPGKDLDDLLCKAGSLSFLGRGVIVDFL